MKRTNHNNVTILELTQKEFDYLSRDMRRLMRDLKDDKGLGAFITMHAILSGQFLNCFGLMRYPCTEHIFEIYRVDDNLVAFMLSGHEEVLAHFMGAVSTKLKVELYKRRGFE